MPVKRLKMIFLTLFLAGLVVQGCGESKTAEEGIAGKWVVAQKLMGRDPINQALNKMVFKWAITLYSRNFAIESVPDKKLFVFKFTGALDQHYEILEKKGQTYFLKNLKDGTTIQMEATDAGQLKIMLPRLKHPLVKAADKPVAVYLSRKKEKKKE